MNESKKIDPRYYQGGGKFTFFRLPKCLFLHPDLVSLSVESKVLYTLLLDRYHLSAKNRWLDKKNRIFLYMTLEEVGLHLGCSRPKASRLMKELEKQGLILKEKQGLGKPDRIYILNNDVYFQKEPELPYLKPHIDPEEETNSSPMREDSLPCRGDSSPIPDMTHPPVQEHHDSSPLGGIELDGNKIERAKTNHIETTSTTEEGLMMMSQEAFHSSVLDEIESAFDEGSLVACLYRFYPHPEKMRAMVDMLSGALDRRYQEVEMYTKEGLDHSAKNLFAEALGQMLTHKGNMSVNGQMICYSHVLEKLVPHIKRNASENISMEDIQDIAIADFIRSSETMTIQNPLAFMKSCLWSTFQTGVIKHELLFHRNVTCGYGIPQTAPPVPQTALPVIPIPQVPPTAQTALPTAQTALPTAQTAQPIVPPDRKSVV